MNGLLIIDVIVYSLQKSVCDSLQGQPLLLSVRQRREVLNGISDKTYGECGVNSSLCLYSYNNN
jgi:hypothetical protein